MSKPSPSIAAFSLVEVVIALAIVSFAMVSILALFSVVLQTMKDVQDQDEATEITTALPAFFQTAGFGAIYTNIQTPGSMAPIFAYASTNYAPQSSGSTNLSEPVTVIDTNNAPNLSSAYVSARLGRVYEIVLSVSTNVAVSVTTNSVPVYLSNASSLPANVANYGDAILPVNVKVYAVPKTTSSTNTPGGFPVLNYDTVLSR